MSTKTLMTASWKLPSSPAGAPGAPDMVKALRDQSQEAPRRFSWSMIVPPDLRLPLPDLREERLAPHLAAAPVARLRQLALDDHLRRDAGMVLPGCQSVSKPRIRCQRTRMSCSVLLKAWPMCSEPVTFGGGIMMQKVSAPGCALAPALEGARPFPRRRRAAARPRRRRMSCPSPCLSSRRWRTLGRASFVGTV